MIKEKMLPMQDLKLFGIYKDGKFTIPEDQVRALQEGKMTDVVELKDLKGKDVHIDSLPARLSIVRGTDGNPSLRIDPVYRSPNSLPQLSTEEKKRLLREDLANIRKNYVDRDGNVRTEIIAYDKNTRQFMSHDPRSVQAPEAVNNEKLTAEQKRKFKEGETVNLADGTQFQFSTTDRRGIRSNRNGLVLSILLDGGISYLLLTGLGRMLGKKSTEEQLYSKGYQEGLKSMQKNMQRRIALKPNDRDAVRDLNNVREELSKVSAGHPANYQNKGGDEVKRFNSKDTEINSPNQSEDERRQRRI
ncbi:DUF4099 domain-containing protein [Cyclobacterium plantarum]|uniref:DUF4099 domain-containing protein n=1 Tax=Cyclobacterium plantarum TaxID=2716263 RepID=A0ABX0H3M5_9BACT|nr:DUF4099 domain-containing protein [Cyclobacterium plantarum]NHE56430.1 DUF4099 domain-containing protein [Cyclobacterium plantarum]